MTTSRSLISAVVGFSVVMAVAQIGCGSPKPDATGGNGSGGAAAAGGATGSASGSGGTVGSGGTAVVATGGAGGSAATATTGLGYNGAITFVRTVDVTALDDQGALLPVVPEMQERVEISAPILPRVSVLYAAEGAQFPTTADGRAALAHEAALTFDFLRDECAKRNPAIVVRGAGEPPTTPAENAANYDAIANCAYEQFVSKPYWIPALVSTVDICGTELGSTWRSLTEDDVANFSERDAQAVAASLATPGSPSSFGNFYFGLTVWVRGANGSLRRGDLSPNAAPRLSDVSVAADSTSHYESGMSLRCIRVTATPAP